MRSGLDKLMKKKYAIQKKSSSRLCHRWRFRFSKIIIWSVFIIVAILSLRIGSQSQRINRTIIRITAADQLGKDYTEPTESDYMNLITRDSNLLTAFFFADESYFVNCIA